VERVENELQQAMGKRLEVGRELPLIDDVVAIAAVGMQFVGGKSFAPVFVNDVRKIDIPLCNREVAGIEPGLDLRRGAILKVFEADALWVDKADVPWPRPSVPNKSVPMAEKAGFRGIGEVMAREIGGGDLRGAFLVERLEAP
jgi:hypothetical protein